MGPHGPITFISGPCAHLALLWGLMAPSVRFISRPHAHIVFCGPCAHGGLPGHLVSSLFIAPCKSIGLGAPRFTCRHEALVMLCAGLVSPYGTWGSKYETGPCPLPTFLLHYLLSHLPRRTLVALLSSDVA
jgi:hypothetical protein